MTYFSNIAILRTISLDLYVPLASITKLVRNPMIVASQPHLLGSGEEVLPRYNITTNDRNLTKSLVFR